MAPRTTQTIPLLETVSNRHGIQLPRQLTENGQATLSLLADASLSVAAFGRVWVVGAAASAQGDGATVRLREYSARGERIGLAPRSYQ
jgi:hypothetical protein